MREFYVLGVVENHGGEHYGHLIFRYLSVHVSRNKAFGTARTMIDGASALDEDGADYTSIRMYEHECGDPIKDGHFYLIRTRAGEVVRDVGGGTRDKDESIRVLDYEVGMVREKPSHEQSDAVTVGARRPAGPSEPAPTA